MKYNDLLFRELKTDIYNEFFYWLDKKGNNYLFSVSDFFYRTRGGLLSGVAANLQGSKILISVDNAIELDKKVRRLSLIYDYIIIRHRKERPPVGWSLDTIPIDYLGENEFREPSYWSKYKNKVTKAKSILYSQNAPHRDTIKEYFEWCVGPGREWLLNGNVVYVPNLPSEQVEQELFSEGVGLSNHYFDSNIFPANDAKYIGTSEIVCSLNLPSLSGCTAEWLVKFREDNLEDLKVFNDYLNNVIKSSKKYEYNKNLFKEDMLEASNEISEEIIILNEKIKKRKNKFISKIERLSYETIPIVVSAFTGMPPWAIALSSVPLAREMILNMVEMLKKNEEFKHSPLYVMTKLV